MTKNTITVGSDKLEAEVSSWSGKYSIRLNDKEIFSGTGFLDTPYHDVKIGERVFRVEFGGLGIVKPKITEIRPL